MTSTEHMSAGRGGGAVRISRDENGGFGDITLRESRLIRAVRAGGQSWSQPILLYGPDAMADIDALLRSRDLGGDWLEVRGFRDLTGGQRGYFHDMESRLDPRFYEQLAGGAATRLGGILRGNEPFGDLLDFVTHGPSGEGFLARTGIGDDFLHWVERLCNTTALLIPWQMKNSFLPAFVLAVWLQRPRLRPLVLHFIRRFGVPPGGGIEIAADGMDFAALVAEVEKVFGLSRADVENGYRVWQLSRSDDNSKPQATTPRVVSQDIARKFLGVLIRARPDNPPAAVAPQKPAPIIFELDDGAVGLRHGVSTADPAAVVQAAASALARRIERLQQDIHVANLVPTSKEILALCLDIAQRMQHEDYSDADVVTLGLEFFGLQWHVGSVKTNIGEVSLGELAGLFATSSLLLRRFQIWIEFEDGGSAPEGGHDSGAAFEIARQLLQGAQQRSLFLTPEAHEKIGLVLERTPPSAGEPHMREGLVRSGENLAAVMTAGLSHVVVKDAKELGQKTKDKAYEEASKAVVDFAIKHSPLLFRLGELRNWPWLTWLHQLMP